jgi:hypothetical protein
MEVESQTVVSRGWEERVGERERLASQWYNYRERGARRLVSYRTTR